MNALLVGPALQIAYRKSERIPFLNALLVRDYERRFSQNRAVNLFRGVFQSFEEARQSAPSTQPLGYDHEAPAAMYRDRIDRVYTNDYPILFWLDRLLPDAKRVFDFGGHVGIAFHAYSRFLKFPAGISWTVCDVPAVVEAGRELAREKGATGLSFTVNPEEADGADLYFASGSLQYVETPLPESLRRMAKPPKHLLLNLLPLHPVHRFVTLQSITTAFCPYLVQHRDAFIAALQDLGYRLVDSWENPDKACELFFQPEYSVRGYSGLYLTRD